MILPGQRLPIVVAMRPVDFRRGHDGLAATVRDTSRASILIRG
jgi:transposase